MSERVRPGSSAEGHRMAAAVLFEKWQQVKAKEASLAASGYCILAGPVRREARRLWREYRRAQRRADRTDPTATAAGDEGER